MNCSYDALYFGDDGYIVRCKSCGHFQLAYASIMLTLNAGDFEVLRHIVATRAQEALPQPFEPACKTVVIQTPATGVFILLTPAETRRFAIILEEADTEAKALSLLGLFA